MQSPIYPRSGRSDVPRNWTHYRTYILASTRPARAVSRGSPTIKAPMPNPESPQTIPEMIESTTAMKTSSAFTNEQLLRCVP
jgi:hypothetical protein